MAGNSRVSTELLIPKSNKYCGVDDDDDQNRRSQIWIEPRLKKTTATPRRKVSVLYYLSRNGHLEHPHLIEVPLSSNSHGLYLRDVMICLNYHRGKGLANMYSWSFKRSYKSGYVWHDVTEDGLIHPTNGHDYVLKGSEILQTDHSSENQPEMTSAAADDCSNSTAMILRRSNQSWSSFDNPQEYIVYKCESNRELAAKIAADAATQTEGKRRRSVRRERSEHVSESVVLSREEMSPPPSNSTSSEVSEGVSGSRDADQSAKIRDRTVDDLRHSGRMKASQVLMQLITCRSVSVKDFGMMRSKQDQGCRARVTVEYGKSLESEAPNQ